MDTLQLTRLLSQNRYTKKYFQGVYPSDLLPSKVRKPALIIANTDSSDKPGSHWVAFFIPKTGPAEYFDSVAHTPIDEKFIRFMMKNCHGFTFSDKRIQDLLTSTCGNYCSVFLYFKSRGISYANIMKKFNSNLPKNEEKLVHLFNKIFLKNQCGGSNKVFVLVNQSCKPCN